MGNDRSARANRRSRWVLAGLLVAFAAVVGYQMRGGSSGGMLSPSSRESRRALTQAERTVAPPEVRLGALEPAEGDLMEPERNPFRFESRVPAVRPGGEPVPGPPSGPTPGLPSAGPGRTLQSASSIPLKFIGVVEAEGIGSIAALSDGTFVYHGRAGDVIEGRYRIVEIGVESIVLEHLDGGGRQTIRLTG